MLDLRVRENTGPYSLEVIFMIAISVGEFVRKLNNFVEKDPDINKEAFIKDAWVASKNDRNYPEGTVVFEVVDNNTSLENLYGSTHELSIYPDRISILN